MGTIEDQVRKNQAKDAAIQREHEEQQAEADRQRERAAEEQRVKEAAEKVELGAAANRLAMLAVDALVLRGCRNPDAQLDRLSRRFVRARGYRLDTHEFAYWVFRPERGRARRLILRSDALLCVYVKPSDKSVKRWKRDRITPVQLGETVYKALRAFVLKYSLLSAEELQALEDDAFTIPELRKKLGLADPTSTKALTA